MDVDLSTDLNALLPLVAPLLSDTVTWPSAPCWPGVAGGRGLARGSIKVPRLRGSSLTAARLAPELPLQVASFTVVGIASTIAYVLLYLLLRGVMPTQAANALSLLVTAVANTAANRRLTFGISGRLHAARHQVKGLIALQVPGPRDNPSPSRREPIERDHLRGEAFEPHPPAAHAEPARRLLRGPNTIPAGRVRLCSGCWRSRRCSTCGT